MYVCICIYIYIYIYINLSVCLAERMGKCCRCGSGTCSNASPLMDRWCACPPSPTRGIRKGGSGKIINFK